jgi:hypothetical protein
MTVWSCSAASTRSRAIGVVAGVTDHGSDLPQVGAAGAFGQGLGGGVEVGHGGDELFDVVGVLGGAGGDDELVVAGGGLAVVALDPAGAGLGSRESGSVRFARNCCSESPLVVAGCSAPVASAVWVPAWPVPVFAAAAAAAAAVSAW